MNKEELEILKKAEEIQLRQKKLLEKQKQEQQNLLKLKRKIEKEEREKIKKIKLQKQLENEAIKKEQFDLALPTHLEHLANYDLQIKEAEDVVKQSQQNVEKIRCEKNKFMRSFHKKCVHSYGPEYTKQYDRYRRCIYCADEICTHEMCF